MPTREGPYCLTDVILHSLRDAAKKLQSLSSDVHTTCQDLQLGCVSLHHCLWPEA